MHSRSDRPQHQAVPAPPRLKIVPLDEDLEILALWSAALQTEGSEAEAEVREADLAQSVSAMEFHALAFKRAAPRRHLL